MPSWLVDHRRVEEDQEFRPARRPAAVDQRHLLLDQPRGQVGRVGDGGRAHDEHRPRAVEGADALQAAHDVGHVRAEDAGIIVQLVDDHVLQVLEQAGPLGVVRQDARMQHVGIGDHDLRLLADGLAHAGRRVAVVGVQAQPVAQGLVQVEQLGQLVLGQGLGRETGTATWPGGRGSARPGRRRCRSGSCPRRWAWPPPCAGPRRMFSSASAWCEKRRSMPRFL